MRTRKESKIEQKLRNEREQAKEILSTNLVNHIKILARIAGRYKSNKSTTGFINICETLLNEKLKEKSDDAP